MLVAALSLLGSVFLGATANGILMLMAYGAGLLAGLLGAIGDAIPSPTLQHIASTGPGPCPTRRSTATRCACSSRTSPASPGAIVQLGPLGGSHDAGPLLVPWSLVACGAGRGVARAR